MMALVNIALYCSKAEIRVPVVGWWVGWVVQTDFHVKPTAKLLWVAFGLGCCCLAWLGGYDNSLTQAGQVKLDGQVWFVRSDWVWQVRSGLVGQDGFGRV